MVGVPSERAGLEHNQPATRRPPFFYGWLIVGVMATAGAFAVGMGAPNFGLFIKPMGDDLGVGRAVFGWAQSVRQITSAFTALATGPMLDRFGARWILPLAVLICGVAMLGLANVTDGWQIVALFALMGVVGMNGPGALVTTVPVTRWFVRDRGRAMAFTAMGTPIGGFTLVPLTQVLIELYGWRTAWVVLTVLGVAIIVPLALVLLRRQPEDLGLRPDGAQPRSTPASDAVNTASGSPRDERSWSRAEAIRTGTFWRLVFVFSLVTLAINSVGVHRVPSFMDRGLDSRLIAYATGLDGLASGVTTLLMAAIASRIQARYISAAAFGMLALSALLSIVADSNALMFAAMIAFGLGIGSALFMQSYIWADYFGRRHQGAIRGAIMPLMLLFGGIGSPLAGYVRDVVGTYDPVWAVAVGLMLLGGLVVLITPKPRHPREA